MSKNRFGEIVEGWMFCGPTLLQGRIERARAVAETEVERALVENMMSQFYEELDRDIMQGLRLGMDVTSKQLVLQTAGEDRYASPLLFGRFQVMGSISPVGTYYIVDHNLKDLILREGNEASNIRRFSSIQEAKNHISMLRGEPPVHVLPVEPAKMSTATEVIATKAIKIQKDVDKIIAAEKPASKPVKVAAKAPKTQKAAPKVEPLKTATVKAAAPPAAKAKKGAQAPQKVEEKVAAKPVSAPKKAAKGTGTAKAAVAPTVTVSAAKKPVSAKVKEAAVKVAKAVAKTVAEKPAPAAQPRAAASKGKSTTTIADPLAAQKTYASYKPKASERFRELIMAGGKTDAEIFAIVKKEFSLTDDKAHYVQWYRSDMKRKGLNPPAPTKEKVKK